MGTDIYGHRQLKVKDTSYVIRDEAYELTRDSWDAAPTLTHTRYAIGIGCRAV